MDSNLLIKLQTEKARRFLQEADDMILQNRWSLAANRFYYACYHIVHAAFITRGIATKTHDGTLTELGKHFILTGQLDKKYGRFFARMIQLRDASILCKFNFWFQPVLSLLAAIKHMNVHPLLLVYLERIFALAFKYWTHNPSLIVVCKDKKYLANDVHCKLKKLFFYLSLLYLEQARHITFINENRPFH